MEPKKRKKLIDLTVIDEFLESGVSAVALVEEPAILVDFMAFRKEKFVEPRPGEKEGDFIGRCMSKLVGDEGYAQDQAAAICYSYWRGGMEEFASYTDYPESAKANAQKALDYAAKNGWGSCGTPVGKVRANQLAKGEPISEDTIARMASFARHQQNSDTPYGEGCGGLMWDAWGGTEGIEWASRKLAEIRKEKMAIEPNPCWEGYEPIGLKPGRGGEMVPNCVPVEALALMYEYQTDYPLFETPEAAADYALGIGCEGYHEHVIGGKTYYMPCETHPEEDMEIVVNAPSYIDQTGESKKKKKPMDVYSETVLKFFSEVGIPAAEFAERYEFADAEAVPYAESGITPKEGAAGKTFYKYDGPPAQREFCRQMLALDRFYTYDEISTAAFIPVNEGFGPLGSDTYDIWKYHGGPNCKHYWRKFYVSLEKGIQNKGKAEGIAGTPTIDQRNSGYLLPKSERVGFSFAEENDQRILVGPAMIPNFEILRVDSNEDPFYVQFSEEAVAKIMEKFMREQSTHNTNQDHDSSKPADTYIFESWLIEDPETDKAKTVYGFEGLPKGTWMVKMRVYSEEVWQRVKNGELKGFSVEGNFIDAAELAKLEEEMALLEKIKDIVK